ncbi:MAG: serine/threonine-protein phosphatase [Spirochaetes bacterium]|nr:serine/threonine-protein phosphatase [Spirochaetota bacterium]
MNHLATEKTQRYRKQLLAAVYTRYFWIALSAALINWFKIPFAGYITIAGAALAVMNTIALISFWNLKGDRVMIYFMISSDSLVLLYALSATGLFSSPFTMVLIVVAAFTVLVTDLKYGFFTAAFSSTGYCVLGILYLLGKLPPELNIPAYNNIMAILHMVVVSTALFTVVGILGFVVLRLQKSEASYFDQGRVLAERNHEMSSDMAIAATVQKAIQANHEYSDDRLSVAGKMKPMLEVGGDYFEIFRFDSGEIGVFVADVSGHGAGSALITAMLKVSLENAAKGERDTGRVLGKINDDMCRIIGQTDFYLTGILCKINPDSFELEYCGAAHPEMFLLSEGTLQSLESEGTILGKLPALTFPVRRTALKKGDRLLIYTDGITEARHKNGEFWGESRLQELLKDSAVGAKQFTAAVFAATDHFFGTENANDDRTLVTVDILAEPRAVSRAASGDLVENIELSRAALAEGNIQRIEEILAKNVTLPIRAAISLIRVLKKQRGLDAAVKQLHNEIAKHGEHPLLLEEIGRNYFSAGKTEEARRYFELAAAKDKAGYSGYYLAKMRAQT